MALLGLRIAAARPRKVSDWCSDVVAGAAIEGVLGGQHARAAGEKDVLHGPALVLAHVPALPEMLLLHCMAVACEGPPLGDGIGLMGAAWVWN